MRIMSALCLRISVQVTDSQYKVILLCLAAAAVILIIRNRDWIKEISTDENGEVNPWEGLERYFTKRGSGGEGTEDEGGEEDDGRPDADFMEMLLEQKGAQMAGMDPETDRIREHIIFHGRVQGVGFRYQAMYAARRFDLTGWVENLPDGSVEMEVQGSPLGIGRMMKHLRSGHWIRIDDMDMEEIETVPGERGFNVRGY